MFIYMKALTLLRGHFHRVTKIIKKSPKHIFFTKLKEHNDQIWDFCILTLFVGWSESPDDIKLRGVAQVVEALL